MLLYCGFWQKKTGGHGRTTLACSHEILVVKRGVVTSLKIDFESLNKLWEGVSKRKECGLALAI